MNGNNETMKKKRGGEIVNEMKLRLPSLSVNEGMARAAVSAFCAQCDPSMSELADIKCAVSEAVTNCIVHGYRDTVGDIYITAKIISDADGGKSARIEIKDNGCGIPDVEQARMPLYTTDAQNERSGMGFTVMESFCDKVKVRSRCGKGTTVVLLKRLCRR